LTTYYAYTYNNVTLELAGDGSQLAYNVYGLNLISRYTNKTDDTITNGTGGIVNPGGNTYSNNTYGFGTSATATQNYYMYNGHGDVVDLLNKRNSSDCMHVLMVPL